MVISRTPFRISFFGGGTDYPAWFRRVRGKVISTTINKYCYITARFLSPLFAFRYRIRYATHEEVNSISEIKHPSVRECLRYLNLDDQRIEMQHNGDLPAMGGLGSSSAFTVGFLNALHALTGESIGKMKLAKDAIHIEQNVIQENVGSQDQTAAAFGGFNIIEFLGKDGIRISPINIGAGRLSILESHLMLFYTGIPRIASEIVREQIQNIPHREKELSAMLDIAEEAEKIITGSNDFFDDFGKLLHRAWLIKRSLSTRIATPVVDEAYQAARESGAIGGKLLGAGGGGFFLIYAKPEFHPKIAAKLAKLPRVDFKFENGGSQIIYRYRVKES